MGNKAFGQVLGISNGRILDSGLKAEVGSNFGEQLPAMTISSSCQLCLRAALALRVKISWSGVTVTRKHLLSTQCPLGGGETFL